MVTSNKKGHDGEILQQQDREAGASGCRLEALLARQELDDDGGRGQREAQADDRRCGCVLAERGQDQADARRRDRHLQHAEAEDETAHGDETLGRELEADQEQEEDDAELGERCQALGAR